MSAEAIERGRLGGLATAARMTPEQLSERGRKAAKARAERENRIAELEERLARLEQLVGVAA